MIHDPLVKSSVLGIIPTMFSSHTWSSLRAALLVTALLLGGCMFDSMGLPSSSPPGDSVPPPEWRHDLQVLDLPPGDLPAGDQAINDLPTHDQAINDLPTKDGPTADSLPKDVAVVDAPVVPDQLIKPLDLGCPTGKTACGGKCVTLDSDASNCGKCGNVCDPKSTDSCVSGVCGCGFSGAPCLNGLNCKQGSCQCVTGATSLCNGCCQNTICYLLGASGQQTDKRCGAKGTTCQSCSDSNACTYDGCNKTTGACYHATQPPTISCDDKDMCTTNDKCVSGTCKGTAMDCSSVDGPCHDGVCNATWGTCDQQAKANNTICQVPGDCMQPNACWCQAGLCVVKP